MAIEFLSQGFYSWKNNSLCKANTTFEERVYSRYISYASTGWICAIFVITGNEFEVLGECMCVSDTGKYHRLPCLLDWVLMGEVIVFL